MSRWKLTTDALAAGSVDVIVRPAMLGGAIGLVLFGVGWILIGHGASAYVALCVPVAIGVVLSGRRAAVWSRRIRPVGRIVSALEDASSGERRSEALRVLEDGSSIAETWNRLLSERSDGLSTRALYAATDSVQGGAADDTASRVCGVLQHGIIVADAFGSVSLCNGAAPAMLRAATTEWQGKPLADLLPDGSLSETLDAVAKSGGSKTTTWTTDDGSVISGQIRSLRETREGREMLVLLEDTTRQHLAQEARSNMIAHAAHELRAPLTNIRLYVEEAIDAGTADAETVAGALNIIQSETRRLERVVGEMLGAAEVESGAISLQRREIRLAQIFEELQSDFKLSAESKEIHLSFDLPPKYPVASADREKLAIAAHNLVGNAIKYTPAGGRVSVRVDANDTDLIVAVTDTGIGITETDHERVFDRFFRVDDERVAAETGTGLGLCLAR
ncbi:MAG: ATP-binding protein, partial [Planctomycetota bacterium]